MGRYLVYWVSDKLEGNIIMEFGENVNLKEIKDYIISESKKHLNTNVDKVMIKFMVELK